jgi:hypothetical protein
LGRGLDGGDDAWPASSASLRVFLFAAPVFMLLARDVFILQVMGVFTCIRSGTTLEADCGGAYRSALLRDGGGGGDREAEGHKCKCV